MAPRSVLLAQLQAKVNLYHASDVQHVQLIEGQVKQLLCQLVCQGGLSLTTADMKSTPQLNPTLRGQVWKILLHVNESEESCQVYHDLVTRGKEHPSLLKTIQSEILRFSGNLNLKQNEQSSLSNILIARAIVKIDNMLNNNEMKKSYDPNNPNNPNGSKCINESQMKQCISSMVWQGLTDIIWPFLQSGLTEVDAYYCYLHFEATYCPLLDSFTQIPGIPTPVGWAGAVAWGSLVPIFIQQLAADLYPLSSSHNNPNNLSNPPSSSSNSNPSLSSYFLSNSPDNPDNSPFSPLFSQMVSSLYHDCMQSLGLRWVLKSCHLHWMDFLICFTPSICALAPVIYAFTRISNNPSNPETDHEWSVIFTANTNPSNPSKKTDSQPHSKVRSAKYYISSIVSLYHFLTPQDKQLLTQSCRDIHVISKLINWLKRPSVSSSSSSHQKFSDPSSNIVAGSESHEIIDDIDDLDDFDLSDDEEIPIPHLQTSISNSVDNNTKDPDRYGLSSGESGESGERSGNNGGEATDHLNAGGNGSGTGGIEWAEDDEDDDLDDFDF